MKTHYQSTLPVVQDNGLWCAAHGHKPCRCSGRFVEEPCGDCGSTRDCDCYRQAIERLDEQELQRYLDNRPF